MNDPIYAYPIDAISQHYALENNFRYLQPSFCQIDFDDYPEIIYFHHEKKAIPFTHFISTLAIDSVDTKSIEIAFSHFARGDSVKTQVSPFYIHNSFSPHGSES